MIFFLVCGYFFLGVGFFSYCFPNYYFSELFLSFLPYHIVLLVVGLVLLFFLLRFYSKNQLFVKRFFTGLLFLGFALLFFFFSKKFTLFYQFPVEQIDQEMTGGIKVLYANIYKNNQEYLEIENLIEKENPDLIFFVEFADHHYQQLKDILEEKYPYSNSTIRSQKYVGNMVFSKKQIDNRADDFPQGAWRYGYFSISYNDKPLYFYLVHASSPSSYKYFSMRNQQISTFFEDFDMHKVQHREQHDKVIVVGDFNTTPWSQYYWNFAQGFSGEFVNITRSVPLLFTRKLTSIPLFWAHIDHIFANKLVSIKDFHLVDIPGSDHKGFSFLIK